MIIKENYLQEGPGAGYTVEGRVSNIDINEVNNIKQVEGKNNGLLLTGITGFATLSDIECESYYYYYGEVNGDVDCKIDEIFIDIDDQSIDDISPDEIKDLIENLSSQFNRFECILGGGWSHSTFDGTLTIESEYDYSYITVTLPDAIAMYIDDATQGENYEVEYKVLDYRGHIVAEYDEKDDAIKFCNESEYASKVMEVKSYYSIDGDGIIYSYEDFNEYYVYEKE